MKFFLKFGIFTFMSGKNSILGLAEPRKAEFCLPTKGERGHIDFSADPVGVGVGVGVSVGVCVVVTDLYPLYLLNQLMEFHQICLDISLGQA